MGKILQQLFCKVISLTVHPLFSPTGPLSVFSLSKSHQTHCRRPPDSVYQHLSAGPPQWAVATAVWGETGMAGWGSWLPQSRCLSDPSGAKTWAPAGPVGMMSPARHRGQAGLDGTGLGVRDWNTTRQQFLERYEREVQMNIWWRFGLILQESGFGHLCRFTDWFIFCDLRLRMVLCVAQENFWRWLHFQDSQPSSVSELKF